jgi:2-polyprenyl-6-methoxyphenol hydroxylase-like FAD-dependent oxidoreductase
MKKEKLAFKDAIALVRKSRPSVLPNLGFERQLKRYEEDLRASNARNSRNSRRKEVKFSESGKSQLLFRTELIPILGAQKLKEKLMSANVRNLMDKITEKDLQVIRTYNRSRTSLPTQATTRIRSS